MNTTPRFSFTASWAPPEGKTKTAQVAIAAGYIDHPRVIGSAIERLLAEVQIKGFESDNVLSKVEVAYIGPETNWQEGNPALGRDAIQQAKVQMQTQLATLNAQP